MFDLRSRLHLSTVLFVLLMVLLIFTAFFPGQMSPDSLDQLSQARSGSFDDLHQPAMAALWRLLLFLWGNAGVLFTFHLAVYGCLWSLLAIMVSPKWWVQLLVLAAACLPPLLSQVIVVWKDSELSLSLLATYLLVLLASHVPPERAGKGNTLKLVLIGLVGVLFYYSAAIRENSLPALVPLALYAILSNFKKIPFLRALVMACLIGASVFLTTPLLNYGILKAARYHGFQVNEIFDIAGVFCRTRRSDLIPAYWKRLNGHLTEEAILDRYTPTSAIPLVFWLESPVRLTVDPGQLAELGQKWMEAIRSCPVEFLLHRLEVFRFMMGMGTRNTYYPYYFGIARNGLGVQDQGDPVLRSAFKGYFSFFRDSLFFRGWFYCLLLVLLAAFHGLWTPRGDLRDEPAFWSSLSGFLYAAGYFAYAPDTDFRFLYPTVTLFYFSFMWTIVGRARNRKVPLRGMEKGSLGRKEPMSVRRHTARDL